MNSLYCPYCGKSIQPLNEEEVKNGEDDNFVYVHDDVYHPDDFNLNEVVVVH